MTVAVAIQQEPLKAALESAANSAKALNDFMYGTPARAHVTTVFAMALVALAAYLQSLESTILNYCS